MADDFSDFMRPWLIGQRPVTSTSSSAFVQRLINKSMLLEGETKKAVTFGSSLGMRDLTTMAVANMHGDIAEVVRVFSQNLKYAANRKVGMANLHTRVAQTAQREILAAYESRPKGPTYRVGQDRYAGGMLRDAIASRDFYLATRDGIFFINRAMLDRKAKQWHRYNYGAGISSGQRPGSFPVRFFGQNIGSIGLTHKRASRGFKVPYGIWIGVGGKPSHWGKGRKEKFFTLKWYQQRKMGASYVEKVPWVGASGLHKGTETVKKQYDPFDYFNGPKDAKGIRARNVFDAGIKSMARNLPREYEQLIVTWFRDAAQGAPRGGFGPLGKSGITPDQAARHLRVAMTHIKTRP